MNRATFSLLMLMTVMLSWRPSEATIQCYECSSYTTKCDDTFNSAGIPIVNCTSNSCIKTKTVIAGVQDVSRRCGTGGAAKCTDATEAGVTATYCECSTDLCNTAAPVVTVTSLVGLTAVAALAAAVAVRVI
jgi:aspartate 1-decarboxylase